MDDIAGKIAELLGSPEGLEKIKGLSGLLGQSLPAASPPPAPEPAQEPSAAFPFPADTLQAVMKIAPLLSSLKQDDESTRLLQALRPLLGPERRKKLDESAKMLQMIRLLPLLKSQGIF